MVKYESFKKHKEGSDPEIYLNCSRTMEHNQKRPGRKRICYPPSLVQNREGNKRSPSSDERETKNQEVKIMPATKKTTKMIRKNPVTGSTYTISKRTDINPKAGKIKGLWTKKKTKKSTEDSRIFVKCGSHRARESAFKIIGEKHQLCSLQRSVGYGCFEVTHPEYEKIKGITGISKIKFGEDLLNCW